MTIVAGVIAIIGVASAYLSRPRLEIRLTHSAEVTIHLSNARGGRPVKDITVSQSIMDQQGRPLRGDGHLPLVSALHRGEFAATELQDPDECIHMDPPREKEIRFDVRPGEIALIPITWQSAILPWTRSGRLVIWRHGSEPKMFKWSRTYRAYEQIYSLGFEQEAYGALRRLLDRS
ncbi:hypothetical protein [Microbacterium sp. KHB019]|uniref:hypothetical protein n=1 Tax=Microbacterium sp. KHB019 TaxID=3129770 RepID=UPI00307AAF7F